MNIFSVLDVSDNEEEVKQKPVKKAKETKPEPVKETKATPAPKKGIPQSLRMKTIVTLIFRNQATAAKASTCCKGSSCRGP